MTMQFSFFYSSLFPAFLTFDSLLRLGLVLATRDHVGFPANVILLPGASYQGFRLCLTFTSNLLLSPSIFHGLNHHQFCPTSSGFTFF